MVTVLGLLVAGCTDDPAPVETTPANAPSPSPSATPSPTPTLDAATAPTRPEEMSTASADGAAAAASYFISLFPYINATGDLSEWDALSSPECSFCSGVRDNVTALHSKGHRNIGSVEILSAAGTQVEADRWYSARIHLVIAASIDVDNDGEVVDEHPEENEQIDVVMTWADGWTIDEVGPASTPGT